MDSNSRSNLRNVEKRMVDPKDFMESLNRAIQKPVPPPKPLIKCLDLNGYTPDPSNESPKAQRIKVMTTSNKSTVMTQECKNFCTSNTSKYDYKDDYEKYYYKKPSFWFCGLFSKKILDHYRTDENIFVALFDYERRSNSDLSFRKGDLLIKVQDQFDVPNEWIRMILLQGRQQGLVPEPYVAKNGDIEAQE